MIKKIVFYFFLGLFPKLIMQIYRMIKNETLGMKIIFKIIKNILSFQINFCFIKHRTTIFKNYS